MKKILFLYSVFLLVFIAAASAETAGRTGSFALTGRLIAGENNGDSVGQLAFGAEYGLLSHLCVGAGFVYVDGRFPIQENGIDLSIKGYLFDRSLDVYGDAGAQLYFIDGVDAVFTLKAGVEWQSSFGLLAAAEGGAEIEGEYWGYMYGLRLGYRIRR